MEEDEKIRKKIDEITSEAFLEDAFVEFVIQKVAKEYPEYSEETIRKIVDEEFQDRKKGTS